MYRKIDYCKNRMYNMNIVIGKNEFWLFNVDL